jgi:hypothetical protein
VDVFLFVCSMCSVYVSYNWKIFNFVGGGGADGVLTEQ